MLRPALIQGLSVDTDALEPTVMNHGRRDPIRSYSARRGKSSSESMLVTDWLSGKLLVPTLLGVRSLGPFLQSSNEGILLNLFRSPMATTQRKLGSYLAKPNDFKNGLFVWLLYATNDKETSCFAVPWNEYESFLSNLIERGFKVLNAVPSRTRLVSKL